MSASPLKIGIIGTGIFANDNHLPVLKESSEKFKVNAAQNRTKSKAIDFARRADFPEENVYDTMDDLLTSGKIDCVDALLPVQNNVLVVEKAIEHNVPIIFEKPIAANLNQARQIIALTDNSKLPVAIAENWLFLNCAREAKKELKKIGNILSFTYNSTGPFVSTNKYLKTEWRRHPEHIGGFLSDGGVHQCALLTDVLGEIEIVSAFTQQNREESGDKDAVFATMKAKSGVIGTYTYGSSFGATNKWTFFKIYGSNGSITLDLSNQGETKLTVIVGDSTEKASEPDERTISEDTYGIRDEFSNFHEAVLKKDKSIIKGTPRRTFHHLAIIDALLESSKGNGQAVKVQQP